MGLDGVLDEPAWRAAPVGAGFRQYLPDDGAPATVATRFRVLWDEDALYVGLECDDPEPPTARASRRDREIDADGVWVAIDSTLDKRTAYSFGVYAAGQQADGLFYNDNEFSYDWDATWESAVATSSAGWSVEMKIPLRVLRIPEGSTQFGFNVSRWLSRRQEESAWRHKPADVAGQVSQMGLLVGLAGIRPVRSLELKPYVATRATFTAPEPAAVAALAELAPCSAVGLSPRGLANACVGLDLRYSLASDLLLVGTVNPDFGQVEADARVQNLTTFETLFPEKRPFFQEGLDLFQTPVRVIFGGPYGGDAFQLFYSRRIGRAPAEPDLPGGTALVYQPAARPVTEALKLSGTVGGATVGLLSAVEPAVDAQVAGALRGTQRTESAVHRAAVRARMPAGEHALVGLTATAVDPLFAPGSRHAHVAGVDAALFDGARDWNFAGQVAASRLSGGPTETLPDGTELGAGAAGWAASAKLSRDNGPLVGFLNADLLTPRFEVNGLGFARRANLFRLLGVLTLRDVRSGPRWERASATLSFREIRDADLEVGLMHQAALEAELKSKGFWVWGAGFGAGLPGADDRELGDGTALETPSHAVAWAYAFSDSRQPVYAELFAMQLRGLSRSTRYSEAFALFQFRPVSRLEAELELSFFESAGEMRSIEDPSPGLYALARQSSRSLSTTLRSTFAFSPSLSLQAYAQLFTSGVAHGPRMRGEVGAGGSRLALESLVEEIGALPPSVDAREAALNVNLILRWEWRLGSALYLVYAHQTANGMEGSGLALDFAGDLGTLNRKRGATNIDAFMVKMDLYQAL